MTFEPTLWALQLELTDELPDETPAPPAVERGPYPPGRIVVRRSAYQPSPYHYIAWSYEANDIVAEFGNAARAEAWAAKWGAEFIK